MLKLTSSQLKDLKKQKREKSDLLFLDNVKIIKDALGKGLKAQYILTDDEQKLAQIGVKEGYKVDGKTIEMLSFTRSPQGIIAVFDFQQSKIRVPKGNFLVLDGIQDPGNAGALIRTATASGFDCIFMVNSVKVTNDKVVRASVGTIFDIDIFELGRSEFAKFAQKNKLSLLKADMDGQNVFSAEFSGTNGLVVGNEGQGVSPEISALCTGAVSIPMTSKVESLNAGISGSIIMYQMQKDKLLTKRTKKC